MSHVRFRFRLRAARVAGLCAALAAAPLHAAVWTVNSTADAPDRDTANGLCDADVDGAVVCTLRAAVMQAGSGDVILLPSGTYTLTRPRLAAEPDARGGDLDIEVNALTIQGPAFGARPLIRAAADFNDRLIDVQGWNTLTLSRVVLDGPDALPGGGGAISGGRIELTDVRIQDSGADLGGAIWSNATLTLTRCEFVGNHARTGGAIWLSSGPNGAMNAQAVSFIGNRAEEKGGALYVAGNTTVSLLNATLYGNRAPEGAAVASQVAVPSWLTLNNATIAGNGGIDGTAQSAIVLGGWLYPSNSVIAGNDAAAEIALIGSEVRSKGYNVIGAVAYDPATSILALDPSDRPAPAYLGLYPPALASWSATGIATAVPAADSPLRDAGHPGSGDGTFCEPTDANGIARGPLEPCDIGAAEYQPAADGIFADGFEVSI
jgi:predicted outer membrane repeat protein